MDDPNMTYTCSVCGTTAPGQLQPNPEGLPGRLIPENWASVSVQPNGGAGRHFVVCSFHKHNLLTSLAAR